ncbi:hypothetical protein SAMD00019534_072820 [Acytostelium subglobosum LB1]|uniref:hypothetical protein n=1 Tax=Acytostelium subglobosum LB1 TaxID=1410327 RepID=UPI00064495A0|nr:hypothetical protein SAMD00019534_072820 [Acytostelium subglobosum LB1]GAM24107.1 hypothetical protein SAMD00019534_072820 [Acytostelium subglobosum LB1]|eukprot:XP_012753143.1 hypothetical protein SAMD00019534_072820 [Acytostelium subglobosum LB1]
MDYLDSITQPSTTTIDDTATTDTPTTTTTDDVVVADVDVQVGVEVAVDAEVVDGLNVDVTNYNNNKHDPNIIPDHILEQWRKDFKNLEVHQQPPLVVATPVPVVEETTPSPSSTETETETLPSQSTPTSSDEGLATKTTSSPDANTQSSNVNSPAPTTTTTATTTRQNAPRPPTKQSVIDMDLGVYGLPQNTTVRGVFWKVALGSLSNESKSEWPEQAKKQRNKYDTLKRVYIVDPRTNKDNASVAMDDPLSQNKDSVWNQFFENETTQKEIGHDITRTYPDIDFFARKDIQDTMTRILFIFSKQYPKIKYLQGMNEILAPLLFACYADSHWGDFSQVYRLGVSPSTGNNGDDDSQKIVDPFGVEYPSQPIPFPLVDDVEQDLASLVRDPRYFEHDAYFLFDALMAKIGKWFASPPSSPMISSQSKKDPFEKSNSSSTSPNIIVVDQCFEIFHQLSIVDPHLHTYLKDMSIEPHLYSLRWLRILLAQVFPIHSLLMLWDAIFRDSLELLNNICIAMLLVIRDSLIGKDYSECLQLLFNYPMTHDPTSLLFTAYTVAERIKTIKAENPHVNYDFKPVPKEAPKPKQRPHYNMSSQSKKSATISYGSSSSSSASSGQSLSAAAPVTRLSNSSSAVAPPSVTTAPANPPPKPSSSGGFFSAVASTVKMLVTELNEMDTAGEVETLKERQIHVSNRIERLIYIVETLRNNDNVETVQSVQEELKSIKKVLNPWKAGTSTPSQATPTTSSPQQQSTSPTQQLQHATERSNKRLSLPTTGSSDAAPEDYPDVL